MSDPKPVTVTRDDLVDLLEEHLDPDFVAKVRAVKAKRELGGVDITKRERIDVPHDHYFYGQ